MQLNISFLQYRLEDFSKVLKKINIKFNIACMTAICLKKIPPNKYPSSKLQN